MIGLGGLGKRPQPKDPKEETRTDQTMKKLELPIHPRLETIFGYPGQAPRVVFYYDPCSEQLMYDDGLESGSANTWAYLLWAAHPSVKGLVESASFLLLDRRERKLYALTREQALQALEAERGAWPAAQPDPVARLKGAQQLMAEFLRWLEKSKAPVAA